MRNIPAQTVAAALSPVRKIDCRIKIQDDRLLFAEHEPAIASDAFLSMQGDNGYETHSASALETGILRVASRTVDGFPTLVYQWIQDPENSWPSWTITDIHLKPRHRPGVIGNKIWYVGDDGVLCTATVTDGFVGDQIRTDLLSDDHSWSLAPIGVSECYLLKINALSNKIVRISHLSLTGTAVTETVYDGVFHCEQADIQSFAVASKDEYDYIYFSIDNGLRTKCIKSLSGASWGEPKDLIPLDYADDTASMQVGGAALINNEVFVVGSLVRSSGAVPLQFYTMGPDHYTSGRDMFIGQFGTEYATRVIGGTEYYFRPSLGIPVVVGNFLYFICPGYTHRARLASWLGGSPSQFTYSVNNISLSNSRDGSSVLSLELPFGIDTSIQPGMTLFLEPMISSPQSEATWFPFGVYEIDAIISPRSDTGTTRHITARPKGIKRLAQWHADASYDYWSQDTRISNCSDRSVNVRVRNFSGDDSRGILPTDFDKSAFLYSTCRPSTSYLSRIKLSIQDGRTVYCGPMVSVFTETSAQAASRIGIGDVSAVDTDMVRTSGLAFIYHNCDTPGWQLWWVQSDLPWDQRGISNCPYTRIGSQVDQTLDPGDYEFMLVYNTGKITAYYRNVEDAAWTQVFRETFDIAAYGSYLVPYSRSDGRGRAGYFARSEFLQETLTTRTRIDRVAADAILLQNASALDEATAIPLEAPFTYNGSTLTVLTPRNGTVGASKNTTPTPFPYLENAPYISYLPYWFWHVPPQEIFPETPWNSPHRALFESLDPNRWIWATYPNWNWEAANEPDAYKGQILRLFNWWIHGEEINDVCFEVEYIDINPPMVWMPRFIGRIGGYEVGSNEAFNHVGDASWGTWRTDGVAIRENSVLCNPAWDYGYTYLRYMPYSRRMLRLYVKGNAYISATQQFEPPAKLHHFYPDWTYNEETHTATSSRLYPAVRVFPHPALNAGLSPGSTHPLIGRYVYGAGDGTPRATRFIAASGEPDISFHDMATEICRRAGVLSVTEQLQVENFTHLSDDWNFDEDETSARSRNYAGIVHLQIKAEEIGLMAAQEGIDDWTGTIVTVSSERIRMYTSISGTITMLEDLPADIPEGSWATISYNIDRASVWVDDVLVVTFPVSTIIDKLMIVANKAISTTFRWQAADMRVDNFVMDLNQDGITLMRRLIGQKRIHFLDNNNGGIKIANRGDQVNTYENPYSMVLTSNKIVSDTNQVTRVRLEGIEVYEESNVDKLKSYGNVFSSRGMNELEHLSQFASESGMILVDADRATRPRMYRGAADPRIEPWDRLWINDGHEVIEAIVGDVAYNLSISEDQAIFDMTVNVEVV